MSFGSSCSQVHLLAATDWFRVGLVLYLVGFELCSFGTVVLGSLFTSLTILLTVWRAVCSSIIFIAHFCICFMLFKHMYYCMLVFNGSFNLFLNLWRSTTSILVSAKVCNLIFIPQENKKGSQTATELRETRGNKKRDFFHLKNILFKYSTRMARTFIHMFFNGIHYP